eukprot:358316-Chlamydomonas_euryale.AAC.6
MSTLLCAHVLPRSFLAALLPHRATTLVLAPAAAALHSPHSQPPTHTRRTPRLRARPPQQQHQHNPHNQPSPHLPTLLTSPSPALPLPFPGACPRSYGTNVARLAGLPERVVRRAAVMSGSKEAANAAKRAAGDEPAAATLADRDAAPMDMDGDGGGPGVAIEAAAVAAAAAMRAALAGAPGGDAAMDALRRAQEHARTALTGCAAP